jgi:hypothetical protein
MERVMGIQHVRDIAPERRDPQRVVSIQPVRQLDERAAVGSPPRRCDVDQPCLRARSGIARLQAVGQAIVK